MVKDKPAMSTPGSSSKLQTHNVQHSMRAKSKHKVKQQQQQKSGPSSQPLASLADLDDDDLANAAPLGAASKSQQPNARSAPSSATAAAADPTTLRKTTFKQVLASPLTVSWPTIPNADARPILYTLLDVLKHESVRRWTRFDRAEALDRREMKRSEWRQARHREKKAALNDNSGGGRGSKDVEMTSLEAQASSSRRPLYAGINSVTHHLESMISNESARRNGHPQPEDEVASPLDVVFVCRSDLDPPKLVAHLPLLACAVNAVCYSTTGAAEAHPALRVVPLPEGAEALISQALGLRRCGILAMATSLLPPEATRNLHKSIDEANVSPLRADWLDAAADSALGAREHLLLRTHNEASKRFTARPRVEQIPTSAPVNLNAVKLAKKHTRADKKAWRKAKLQGAFNAKVVATKRNRRQRREQSRVDKMESSVRGTKAAVRAKRRAQR